MKEDFKLYSNFFTDFFHIKDEFKKIKTYNIKEYKEMFGGGEQTWPGKRSGNILDTDKFLGSLILETCRKHKVFSKNYIFQIHTHLRLAEDDVGDFIHVDNKYGCEISGIVYLSDTNLQSGTTLYTSHKEDDVLVKSSAVQNNAIFFKSGIFHKSSLNFGDNIDNGRLTLNLFCTPA
jgi:hypothetical protein